MEEMIATPTSYSLLSYSLIVLCFKIEQDKWMKSPSFKWLVCHNQLYFC